jgi:hypothetical protein
MELLAELLRDDGHSLIRIANDVAHEAKLKQAQPRRARGFQVVKDWDGTGITHDRRWRGGQKKKHSL